MQLVILLCMYLINVVVTPLYRPTYCTATRYATVDIGGYGMSYSLQVGSTCTCTYLPWVVSEGGVV